MKYGREYLAGVVLAAALTAGLLTGCGAGSVEEGGSREVSEALEDSSAETVQDDKEKAGDSGEDTSDGAGEVLLADTDSVSDGADDVPVGNDDKSAQEKKEEDPTLGGIFELYTPEEYAEVVEQIKKYGAGSAEDIADMEADLERLKADNGKGEFIIYKGAFTVTYETEDGGMVEEALNPCIVMTPEKMGRNFTAKEYQEAIESVKISLDKAIADGLLNEEQKERILDRMNENLSKFQ